LILLPQHRLGVVVAANDGNAGALVNRVAQRALALMLEAKTGRRQPAPQAGFRPASEPWTDDQRQAVQRACVGEHATVAGPLSIHADGPRLSATLGERRLELLEGEQGRLGLRYRVLGLVPVSLGPLSGMGLVCERVAGREVLLGILDGQRLLVGERLPPAGPLAAAASAWIGRYRARLAPGEVASVGAVQVGTAAGRLWVEHTLNPAFGGQRVRSALLPLSDTRARLVGPLADAGPVAALETRAGQAPLIRFSGWVFEREEP